VAAPAVEGEEEAAACGSPSGDGVVAGAAARRAQSRAKLNVAGRTTPGRQTTTRVWPRLTLFGRQRGKERRDTMMIQSAEERSKGQQHATSPRAVRERPLKSPKQGSGAVCSRDVEETAAAGGAGERGKR